jgi:hypothetical protein
MNFHPQVLSQAALLDRPRTRKELDCVVATIEEKGSIVRERRRVGQDHLSVSGMGVGPREMSRVVLRKTERSVGRPAKCWGCGHPGHLRRSCPGKVA